MIPKGLTTATATATTDDDNDNVGFSRTPGHTAAVKLELGARE